MRYFSQPQDICHDCTINVHLMCRHERRDTLHFFMIILPFFVSSIGGVITAGYGWWLLGWLGYMLFFFFVWEARVLCSHCPYWAEEGRILRCHANYGVVKLWRYHPEPMGRSEQAQFILGVLIFLLFPIVFTVMEGQYLLAGIQLAAAASFGYSLHRNICSRCFNFSCPLNNVPEDVVQAYRERNELREQGE